MTPSPDLQDVAAQILVFYDVHKLFVDVGGINFNVLLFHVGGFERNLVEHLFENGVKAAGANVFGLLVDAGGESRQGRNSILRESQLQALGFEQRGVLLYERIFRLGEDADEILFLEGLQLDANGQPPLEFGDQIGGFGHVKSAGGDEQDMISANHAVPSVDGCAFNDGENVALDAFAGDVRAMAGFAAGDFIDLVNKDDAHLLGALDGHARDHVHVQQLVFFFLNQVFEGVGHAHFALFLLLAEDAGDHVSKLRGVHVLKAAALVGDDFERGHHALADFEVYHALIELAFAKLSAEFFAGALVLLALRGDFGFGSAGSGGRQRRQQ